MSDNDNPDPAAALTAAMADAREVLTGAGGALVPFGSASPDVVKESYAIRRANTARHLDRQRREVEAVLGPLTAQLARLEEGLWTVSLYLGRDEEIEQLATGAPAPADTTVTLRQLVLAMDEECLIAAETGGLDARSVDRFGAWLTEDPAHLHQVLPDRKGVVVLVPSRQRRDYGDSWMNTQMDEVNARSYWLIRNGDNVYLMTTDIRVGDRLLPRQSEFVDFFYRDDGWGADRQRVPLEPGTDEWLTAEAAADRRRRHYMRIMLVLQGLADRTAVLHPLPAAGVNFLSLAAQDAGTVRIINEIDNVLTSGREPFRRWQHRLNRMLHPGMRIIGAFHGGAWSQANEHDRDRYGQHSRLSPQTAGHPTSGAIFTIEERRNGEALVFRYKRPGTRWARDSQGYWGEHEFKTRASCTVYPADDFILPFDLVDVAELETYLHARTERHEYLTMIPVIKAAIAAKHAEAAAEAPFRQLLAGRIAASDDVDVADVVADLDSLVAWWKLTNRRHRPLVADPEAEAKAIEAIEREWRARRASAALFAERDPQRIARIRDLVPDVICIARRRDGGYTAYRPAATGDRHWLTVHTFTATTDTAVVREWVMVPGHTLATQQVLWSTSVWAEWNHAASRADYLTGPECDAFLERLLGEIRAVGTPIAGVYQHADGYAGDGRTFRVFAWADADRPDGVPTPSWPGPRRDPGQGMCEITASWRRGQDGQAVLTAGRPRYDPRWACYLGSGHATPWRPADSRWQEDTDWRLIWSDPEQMARVDAVGDEIEAAERAERDRSGRVWALVVRAQNDRQAVAEARAKARFLEDYAGAEDLWDDHKKTMDTKNVDMSWFRPLAAWLVDTDVDLADLTVAQAAALWGRAVNIPEDFADVRLGDPPDAAR